ncbi:hypothetical protein HELRODRAFT_72786 [Helobdella robusta]|uniref:Calx-beta domain-containing protein n=1 Tax=Helobdella robusta TaxID=6412 RepID=T1G156_HELRO|nr:hypothetical protein HELRODRAFT_72786 [Helobdella robusta]ESO09920.1 hypothetical protein HELRODRAFT_72786 [Helobdella robusta]
MNSTLPAFDNITTTTTNNPLVGYIDLTDYPCSDKGLLLPLVCEYTWPHWCRVIIYTVGLVWCFLGVAIVADIFMCSIEKITSHVRKIKVASEDAESGYEEIEIWNDTVANLTLMALGSSAPEILLACIEIVGKGFVAGDLGPGTIVGSAAFNLFCITGICVAVIPKNEVRRIDGIKVFGLTSLFSLFAYIWLVIVLILITPNEIELWEAILTFSFFPIMVVLAYLTDKNCFKKSTEVEAEETVDEEKGVSYGKQTCFYILFVSIIIIWLQGEIKIKKIKFENILFLHELNEIHANLTEDELLKLATMKFADEQPKNRLWYRINATKQLGGNPKLIPGANSRMGQVRNSELNLNLRSPLYQKKAILELATSQCAILERDKKVTITVYRYGNMSNTVRCRLETIDGTAEAVKDYIPIKQEMVFEPNETEKSIDIIIIDDDEWEPDEVFFVKLSLDPNIIQDAMLGSKAIEEITILNDDEPGVFEFEKPSFVFKETVGFAEIPVMRRNGADGKVIVQWITEDITAIEGRDYKGREGSLMFESGEIKKNLEILIFNDKCQIQSDNFSSELLFCTLGDQSSSIQMCEKKYLYLEPLFFKFLHCLKEIELQILFNNNSQWEFDSMMNRLLTSANVNIDTMRVETVTWGEQFRNAMNVNGGDLEGASSLDYFMHFLTFGWKLLFAFIPPTHFWKGWLSFFVSLIAIGLLTTIIGDLAAIFGCLVGLKDSVTAITFVALGTSLPDLFASKQAATMEKTADNAIGNVTGSNSVNVFLGLGLPWVLASVYWRIKEKPFEVQAGSLSFSVVIYVVLAIICLVGLMVRRYNKFLGKAELGGPTCQKTVTAVLFICMWIIYALLSSLQAYGYIKGYW